MSGWRYVLGEIRRNAKKRYERKNRALHPTTLRRADVREGHQWEYFTEQNTLDKMVAPRISEPVRCQFFLTHVVRTALRMPSSACC